jgi:parvulin-like peptidyl-prolyl isomerase
MMKEDQLMYAAFDNQEKRRLNRVMDALGFNYPDYAKFEEEAAGVKRKRNVSIMKRQAERLVKKARRRRKWLRKNERR